MFSQLINIETILSNYSELLYQLPVHETFAEHDHNAYCDRSLLTFPAGKTSQYFIVLLKPVLTFQTLRLAMFGKWANERVFPWINLTSNADYYNSIISTAFKISECNLHLTGLSRLFDASQPPVRHARYFKTSVKILVHRTLKHHISFPFDGISFHAQSIHVVWCHNNQCKQSVARFLLYNAIFFFLDWKERQLRFCGFDFDFVNY